MRLRRFLEQVLGSFHSAPLYAATLRAPSGNGIGYLALLCTLLAAVFVARMQLAMLAEDDAQMEAFVRQVPELRFEGGKARSEPSGEQRIELEGQLFAIIDTDLEGIPDDLGGAKLFMTRDHVAVVKDARETQLYSLAELDDLTITQDDLRGWYHAFVRYGWLGILPFMVLFIFVGYLCLALLLSLVALAARAALGLEAPYEALLRVTTLAMTPMLLLDLLNDLLHRPLPAPWWAKAGLAAGFIVWGLAAARERPPTLAA